MKYLNLLVVTVLCFSCQSTNKKSNQNPDHQKTQNYGLELIWESDTLIRTPESVLLDPGKEFLYVSNINEGPWEKDGNGFISKMDVNGNVTILKWVEGLNAPKGMGILGNSLFIADIDEVVEAKLETGEIIQKIKIEGDPQLNDITVGGNGVVYISGSNSQKIYALKNGTVTVFFEGEEGERFNGLFWEKERMLLITSASSQFKEINQNTKKVHVISEEMGHGDAICPVGNGGYITTSWAGSVFYVNKNGETQKLLDTESLGENAADADFDIQNQILYLPTFFKNKIKAYKLVQQ